MDVKILVATHKKYKMPEENIYIPLHVGREGKQDLGYIGDNTGENISIKNPNYCELTGLYWAYKNLKCEYIGLCHYRRYFTMKNIFKRAIQTNNKLDLILNKSQIEELLSKYNVILPKKRNYYIETIESHYKNAHHIEDLKKVEKIIETDYPEYMESFKSVMNGRTLHLYNMFIMKKDDFDKYCEWLFHILFKLEENVDVSSYDNYQKRIYGFLSERLFNVWIAKQEFNIKELPILNMEKVEWVKKIKNFLKRKFK
ncbi:exopolysaccharide biosynthesis protein [Clostridiaceae bacterium 14S0207]|nr:exopolysaccharide biosynthesis protein [Clostridiaceae bacterium 14S0207]